LRHEHQKIHNSQHQVANKKQKMAVAGRKIRIKSACNFDHIFLEKLALFLQIEERKKIMP